LFRLLLPAKIEMQLHFFFEVGAKLTQVKQHADAASKLLEPFHRFDLLKRFELRV
jgi:hypothetical protein